jgi:protein-S-isoprenylcysteine O-methyltransferase Ste14
VATPLAQRINRVTVKTVPVYLAIAIMVWWASPRLSWFIPGLVLVLAGEALRVWAAGHLRKTKEVTTTGPYAYVKNPLYLGTFLLLTGFCLMAANLWLLAVGLAIFIFYYAPFKKKREGQRLFERFGPAWAEYDAAVPDYVPRLTPYPKRGTARWSRDHFYENSEHGSLLAVVVGVLVLSLRFWI